MLKEAGKSRLPLIFLPLHRSHMDYVMISFILLNNSVRCPLIAAGDNLRMPIFGLVFIIGICDMISHLLASI